MVDQRLVACVDALEPIAFRAEAFRHVAAGRNPLSGSGARANGGRWNPPDSFATLYLALELATVVAEFHRLAVRQLQAPEDFLPRRLYRYEIVLAAVLDLRVPTARKTVELKEADLVADDPAACRRIGEAAQYVGLEAILAPSATGIGTVLAVFFDRLRADSYVRDVDYEIWTTAPPRSR